MDEAFSLVAARMPPTRRFSPFGVRMVVMLIVVAMLIAGFGAFVVGQQRAADRRRAALVTSQAAAQDAQAQALAAGGIPSETVASTDAVAALLDGQARDAATAALAVAAEVASSSSYDDARPAALAAHDQQLLYVEGPSTAASVVSVYNGAAGWAAAVHGSGDTCYWVAVAPDGRTRFGSGPECTGMAALAADRPAW
jgi:type II secretory pathway pseudopilin PulG